MEDELKPMKKKRSKRLDNDSGPATAKGMEALAILTSSDVIRQVKAGLSFIAPLEMDGEEEPTSYEEPPSL